MTPPSRSGDGWSETSWSQPSYGNTRASGAGSDGSRSSRSRTDDDWGAPSYSRPDAAPAGASRRPAESPRRPTESPRRPTESPRRGADGPHRPVDSPRARQRSVETREAPRAARTESRYGTAERSGGTVRTARGNDRTAVQAPVGGGDSWSPAGPTAARDQRATRAADRRAEQERLRTQRSVERLTRQHETSVAAADEHGMRWFAALALLIGITALGAIIDSLGSSSTQNGFNYGIVVASLVAIVVVRRSQMFPIVVAPPIVYFVAAMVQLYLKSSLSTEKHGLINTLLDAVQNYLVDGFPALASATAGVLIIAGARLILRK